MISGKEGTLLELKHLESSLSEKKNEIEIGVENLEGKESQRSRKEGDLAS